MTVRNGSAEWHGDVESGSGTVTVGDGLFEGAYSYDSRFGEGKGTNPEQLIAAAHASCFTMALSNILSAAGHAPESLRTNARVQLRNIDGAPTLARIDLATEGRVTGVDEQQFQAHADEAKRVCPVSRTGRDPRDRLDGQACRGRVMDVDIAVLGGGPGGYTAAIRAVSIGRGPRRSPPIYTEPEIASVGLTEKQARQQYGDDVTTGLFPWVAKRACRDAKRTRRLGQVDPRATARCWAWVMVGPHVTDMVEAGVIAIDAGATVETVADGMAPHPTLSEAIKGAGLVALGRAIDVPNRKPTRGISVRAAT
jgi:osmotically inducible protein OsmC